MSRRFLVIGLGRFGAAVARGLEERDCEVVAADKDMTMIERIKDEVDYAVQLDATDPEALRSVDAAACEAAIVAMGDAFEASVLCIAALRELGVEHIVARSRNELQGRILTLVGATRVVQVESEIGRRLAESLAAAPPAADGGG